MSPGFSNDDVAWAIDQTEVIHEPARRIDTFGSTVFNYLLISELMDSVNEVRVREGRMEAMRPQILRPEGYDELMFEGFTGEQATAFREWFEQVGGDLTFLKYGFSFTKTPVSEHIAHEPIEAVCDRVMEDLRVSGDPMTAAIRGVDEAWEICLIKFSYDMIEKSHGINTFDFKRRGLL